MKTATKSAKRRSSKSAAPEVDKTLLALPLPPAFQQLLASFAAVSTVYNFLVKNKLVCTLAAVAAVLGQADPATAEQEIMLMLRRIVAMDKEVVQLQYVPKKSLEGEARPVDAGYSVEIAFPTADGTTNAQSTLRFNLVRAAAAKHLQRQHEQQLPPRLQPWDYKSGWHPSFALDAIRLPDPVPMPEPPAPAAETEAASTPPSLFEPGFTGYADGDRNPNQNRAGQASGSSDIKPAHHEEYIASIIEYLKTLPMYQDQIAHIEHVPPRAAEYGELEFQLPEPLRQALDRKGIHTLFKHQTEAINAACHGMHVGISTSTSSGKSIIYNVPVLRSILFDRSTVALYMFPTKALAQDQLRALLELCTPDMGDIVRCFTCDGDTTHAERSIAKDEANIMLTNPDMLHVTLLPSHKAWKRVFANLKYVVIDEAHTYTGSFGSHVSGVLRRLVRVCAHYGASPQFICCSATIANPREHFERFVPLNCLGGSANLHVVSNDTSPRGHKLFLIWNPPMRSVPAGAAGGAAGGAGGTEAEAEAAAAADVSSGILTSSTEAVNAAVEAAVVGEGINARVLLEDEDDYDGDDFDGNELVGVEVVEAPPARPADVVDLTHVDEEESVDMLRWRQRQLQNRPRDPYTGEFKDENDPLQRFLAVCAGAPHPYDYEIQNIHIKVEKGLATEQTTKRRAQTPTVNQNEEPTERRRSTIVETACLFTALVKKRIRTLAFCRVRKVVEMVLRYSLQDLNATAPQLASLVSSYRGGYTKRDRRAIEAKLFGGELIGVTATCALELGVDIGSLDVTLHCGFPGSISSLWQQAGRSGRGGRDSLSILICFDSPIDQWFARTPSELFGRSPEAAIIEPFNPYVLRGQLVCASRELPLNSVFHVRSPTGADLWFNDTDVWGGMHFEASLAYLLENRQVTLVSPMTNTYKMDPSIENPSRDLSLRVIDPITFEIVDESRQHKVIDHVGYSRAFYELYEGAIYMHQARQYMVTKLDIVRHCAIVRPVKVAYFTTAQDRSEIETKAKLETSVDGIMSSGYVSIVRHIWGYRKVWLHSGKVFESSDFSVPPLEFDTRAFWVDIPSFVRTSIHAKGYDLRAAIHTVNHALVAVVPLFIMSDPGDIGTEHEFEYQKRPKPPRLIVYDQRPGGLGIAESLFYFADKVLHKVLEFMRSCPCALGCPACVHSTQCGDYNGLIDKAGAIDLAELLIQYRERFKAEMEAAESRGLFDQQQSGAKPLSRDTDDAKLPPTHVFKLALQPNTDVRHFSARSSGGGGEEPGGEEPRAWWLEEYGRTQAMGPDTTPRKKRRRAGLQAARSMDKARKKALSLQQAWSEVHNPV